MDLNEQYLNRLYDDLVSEQQRLMTVMKNSKMEEEGAADKERDIMKQLSLLNTIMINALKYRNLKKTILAKCPI